MAENKKEDHGQVLLNWQVPEYTKHERTVYWYIISPLVGIGIIIYSLFTGNFFLIIIIILTAIIFFVYHRQEPLLIDFAITEDGLVIGHKFYPYREIKNFWLIYQPPKIKALYIDFKSVLRPHLDIPLDRQNPLRVREILLKYLEEDTEQDEEPLLDALGRYFKF